MNFDNLAKFSPTQEDAVYHSNARINFFHGPVRSGKTTSQRFASLKLIANTPHKNILVSGKTKDTIKRNVLDDLFDLFVALRVPYLYNQSQGLIKVLGKTLHVVGANDESSTDRIHGMTMGGWLGDEMTLHPESFVKMALSRMSMAGAKAYWTTNPDSPFHYLKREYLDNKELIRRGIVRPIAFKLEDNLSLDEEYLESLQLMYTGLWRKRMILGLWVMAEGAIYDMFEEGVHTTPHWPTGFSKVIVGADYGTANATAFLMLGKSLDPPYPWVVFREYYYDAGQSGRQKTNGEYAEDLKKFLKGETYPDPYGELYPTSIELDPSAASFRVECKARGINRVRLAENDVVPGIQVVGSAFANEDLVIHEVCENAIMEAMSYVWDPKAQERGEDKPLKDGAQDHALDGLRYGVVKAIGKRGLQLVATA